MAKPNDFAILGWMVVLKMNGKSHALPAAASLFDKLTEEEQKGLPSLGGVWETEQEAKDVLSKIPFFIRVFAEITRVSVHAI